MERRTRFLILIHVPTGRPTAEIMRAGITSALGQLPADLRRTLTWDQGKELALHQRITEQIGTRVFFCDALTLAARQQREHQRGPGISCRISNSQPFVLLTQPRT